jgi:hypothetical protein
MSFSTANCKITQAIFISTKTHQINMFLHYILIVCAAGLEKVERKRKEKGVLGPEYM